LGTYKSISAADIKTSRSSLNQLVDCVQTDFSASVTRQKFQVFVTGTGGGNPGCTSSLYQTVHDQKYSLQTSNAILDLTVGLWKSGTTVSSCSTGEDSAGKLQFPSETLMMREKTDIYRQYVQTLLGSDTVFQIPYNGSNQKNIDNAMFINIKRLFARDAIKKETFAMRMYASACIDINDTTTRGGSTAGTPYSNLDRTTTTGSKIWTDIGASSLTHISYGGTVGNIVDSADTSNYGGLIFYDQGIIVMDLDKCISGSQHCSGVISSMSPNSRADAAAGQSIIGSGTSDTASTPNYRATFIPSLMRCGSIDDIVDHLASCRFQSGSLTAMTFQNVTEINSTLIFCRATADEFNYSSNPTFTDSDDRLVVVDVGQESVQRTFSFITSVGLYDNNNNLLAVAKLSRPVQKSDEKDLTVRIRLDF